MKSLLLATIITLSATAAFADHSLLLAMDENAEINDAVVSLINKKNVYCDIDHSIQMAVTTDEGQEAYRQVTLCYSSLKEMQAAIETLTKGNQFGGLYGLPAVAVLDVTYTWENSSPGTLVEATLK